MSKAHSVFHDIEEDATVAANLEMRAMLMMALTDHITEQGWTQVQAAEFFGTSQPRMSKLLAGDIEGFSIDCLINWLHHAGRKVELSVAA